MEFSSSACAKRKVDQVESAAVQPPPPPPQPLALVSPAAPTLPADIHALLAMCNLTQYAEALVDDGYDDVEFLCEMGDDKIDTILAEAGMAKVGHRKRFVHLVQKLRAAAA